MNQYRWHVWAIVFASFAVSNVRSEPLQADDWDTTLPRGSTRDIDFRTSEGTWMSTDVSPDGDWIVFDLLDHIYRVSRLGGRAECLTQYSGVAENFHPRYSPDGKSIAFVSDRSGAENLWVMNADGTSPHAIFNDDQLRVFEPVWTHDGKSIVVRQHRFHVGLMENDGIWIYSLSDGGGKQLVGPREAGRLLESATLSPDDRYVYFDSCTSETGDGCTPMHSGGRVIFRLDRKVNEIIEFIGTESGQEPGAIAPAASPNGRWLAFARKLPDSLSEFRGHLFGPRTALWIRDLKTGSERVLMDPVERDLADRQLGGRAVFGAERTFPGYGWASDSKSIVLSQGGHLRRVNISDGTVATIPFEAVVHRTVSEQVYSSIDVAKPVFDSKMLRWHAGSHDGRRLLFQALGKIWVQNLPSGTPVRLTSLPEDIAEYSPAWSPDDAQIAFTTMKDGEGGSVVIVRSSGASPREITAEKGEYWNPDWSADAKQIVVTRGAGASLRNQLVGANAWYEIVTVPARGGMATHVATLNPPRSYYHGGQIWQATYGRDGRIYFPDSHNLYESTPNERLKHSKHFGVSDSAGLRPWQSEFEGVVTELVSTKGDGSDRKVHMVFPYATAVSPSPDGRWVAFQEGDNIYLSKFVESVERKSAPRRVDRRETPESVVVVTKDGGFRPRWLNATTLEYGAGSTYGEFNVHTRVQRTVPIKLEIRRNTPRGSVALTNARVIALHNDLVIERGTIIIKDGRIACVGTCDRAGVDKVVDLTEKTIAPGWIDMHCHAHHVSDGIIGSREWMSAAKLAYGVTTCADPATYNESLFAAGESIEAGRLVGPRTLGSGEILWSGDSPHTNRMLTRNDVENEIKSRVALGAVFVKQYTLPLRKQRQWVVQAAGAQGLRVTAEGEDNNYDIGMIMDGQTGFEHNAGYAPVYADVTTFLGKARAVYSATLIVVGPAAFSDEYFRAKTDLWKDLKMREWFPSAELMQTQNRMLRPDTSYAFPVLAEGMKDVVAAGGYGALGSHGQQIGIDAHWDLWIIASALGPMKALEIASRHGAHFLGVEGDLGTIEVGKIADLLVFNRNILADIRTTNDLQYVMKAGILYDAKTLDEVWPHAQSFGLHPWKNDPMLRNDTRSVDYWEMPH